MAKLSRLTVNGYKSIRDLETFKLTNLNILIGANGAGKSNFISVFKLLEKIYQKRLQEYVIDHGGPDSILYYGRKVSDKIRMAFYFDQNGYELILKPTPANELKIINETLHFTGAYTAYDGSPRYPSQHIIQVVGSEAKLKESTASYAEYIKPAIESWRVYHFHDTSDTALVKQIHSVSDNLRLKPDASNLAAFLNRLELKFPQNYSLIIKTIRLVAPFFDDFFFRDEESIQLEWKELGNSDTLFKAHVLSDGTLRFICLATLLLQPRTLMADTILIDEPELGLHPFALNILADLIKIASEKTQLIISTQSVELINNFTANDIIVVDRENNASTFKRLDESQLEDWLDDYSLGELWQRNIIGGRPG